MNLDFESKFKKNVRIIAVIGAMVAAVLFFFYIVSLIILGDFIVEMIQVHFVAIVGLPFVALLSFFIVVILESSFGNIEFEGLGFKFKGASGPIVLWTLCYLVISITIKILW